MRSVLPSEVRERLIARREIAFIDLRDEAEFALDHPLFASQIPLARLAVEAAARIPRLSTPIVLYDAGEGLVSAGAEVLTGLGYTDLACLEGGLAGWRAAGYELFQDVNSYAKAFGELVESRRHTPSLPAEDVKAMIDGGENMVIFDARAFEEYATMAIPGGISVPGAELVLRARALAPDPETHIIVNCAGRTRSLIGAQSLVNAGVPNRVHALRNGTIGWLLARNSLAYGQSARFGEVTDEQREQARADARAVSYRAGVRRIDWGALGSLESETDRTLYRFDVRTGEEYLAGHPAGFLHAPGGQLVQEIDIFAPVRGARIILYDELGVRAHMTSSWLAQMGWDVYVLEDAAPGTILSRSQENPPARGAEGRYKRPYVGTDIAEPVMQAYLDWEYGLVDQLERDASHGFFVV